MSDTLTENYKRRDDLEKQAEPLRQKLSFIEAEIRMLDRESCRLYAAFIYGKGERS